MFEISILKNLENTPLCEAIGNCIFYIITINQKKKTIAI